MQHEFAALGGVPRAAALLGGGGDGRNSVAYPKRGKRNVQELVERIRREGRNLGRGILKVDGFVNHQLDPALTMAMGRAFADAFAAAGVSGVTKIITAEVSGIAPALTTAMVLNVPVIYARRRGPSPCPTVI